jgi:AcrR family transcriptional regulator
VTTGSPTTVSPPAGPVPVALRRDAQRNRERILAVAGEVFATQGLNASMNDIAAAAGVGVGTVYRRFPERVDLIRGVFEHRLAGIERLALRAGDDPDPWAGITWLFEEVLALETTDRGLTQLLADEELRVSLVDGGGAKDTLRSTLDTLVARAQASGQLRGDVGAGDFIVLRRMLTEAAMATRAVRPEYWRRMLAVCLDGLRAGEGARLPGTAMTVRELEQATAAGLGSRPGGRTPDERPDLPIVPERLPA